jgi:hypothetical protein
MLASTSEMSNDAGVLSTIAVPGLQLSRNTTMTPLSITFVEQIKANERLTPESACLS